MIFWIAGKTFCPDRILIRISLPCGHVVSVCDFRASGQLSLSPALQKNKGALLTYAVAEGIVRVRLLITGAAKMMVMIDHLDDFISLRTCNAVRWAQRPHTC